MKITLSLIALWIVCQLAALLAAIRFVLAIFTNQDRAWLIAKAYDRLGNAISNDDEVQTISSRAAKAQIAGKTWGCWMCAFLDSIQKDHCKNSLE